MAITTTKFNTTYTKKTITAYLDDLMTQETTIDIYVCNEFFKLESIGNMSGAKFINDTARQYENPNYILEFYVCPFHMEGANNIYRIPYDGKIAFNWTGLYKDFGGIEDSKLANLISNWPSQSDINPDGIVFEQGITPPSGKNDYFCNIGCRIETDTAAETVTFDDYGMSFQFDTSQIYNCGLFNKKLFRPLQKFTYIGTNANGVKYCVMVNPKCDGAFYIAGVKKVS